MIVSKIYNIQLKESLVPTLSNPTHLIQKTIGRKQKFKSKQPTIVSLQHSKEGATLYDWTLLKLQESRHPV